LRNGKSSRPGSEWSGRDAFTNPLQNVHPNPVVFDTGSGIYYPGKVVSTMTFRHPDLDDFIFAEEEYRISER